jgi:hypothetical protein
MLIDQASDTEDFSVWLRQIGFTRTQAAKALGKSYRMIEYYENGYPVSKTVQLLMDALRQGYRPNNLK